MAKVWVSLGLMVLAPLIVFAAVVMVQMGVVSRDFAIDVLTLKVAMWTAFVAVGFAVLSAVLSLGRFRRLGVVTLAVLVGCAGIAAVFVRQSQPLATQGPLDVATNLSDPPVVSGTAGPVQSCDGVAAVPSQVAIEVASYSLVKNGFTITDGQLFQARGVRQGFWFGIRHEAVIRIRPGQTDVRVVARYDRSDGGETCRLMAKLVDRLQVAGR